MKRLNDPREEEAKTNTVSMTTVDPTDVWVTTEAELE
jgi:regulation of enolase protein 1 (concanavalin A-like superfamily)